MHQAMDLCVRMLTDPGDSVLIEEPESQPAHWLHRAVCDDIECPNPDAAAAWIDLPIKCCIMFTMKPSQRSLSDAAKASVERVSLKNMMALSSC